MIDLRTCAVLRYTSVFLRFAVLSEFFDTPKKQHKMRDHLIHSPLGVCGADALDNDLSSLERASITVLGYVPGMRRVASSRRMILAIRGSFWTIVGYAASQLLRLASTLVLARQLLSPQAFGLVALVNVFLTGLDMLSDLGIGMDVVQHARGDDPAFINTAFLIQAGRGFILWAWLRCWPIRSHSSITNLRCGGWQLPAHSLLLSVVYPVAPSG